MDGHGFKNNYPEEILTFLWRALGYGEIQPGTDWEATPAQGRMVTFDNTEFYPTEVWNNSDQLLGREDGYIYIPNQCDGAGSSNCRLHFVLHGCGGWPRGYMNKGYQDLAITNNLIIVWPDTRCWDNHGQISEGEAYKTNDGTVHRAFQAMIERLTEESGPEPEPSCQTWIDLIQDAQASVASVVSYLAGDAETWTNFDASQLDNVPSACNLSQSLTALR